MVQQCKNNASKNFSATIQWSAPNNLINIKQFTIFALIQKQNKTTNWSVKSSILSFSFLELKRQKYGKSVLYFSHSVYT